MRMKIFTLGFYISIFFLTFLGYTTQAATIVSKKSGNWSDKTTWQPEQVPTAADIVTISALHSVTVDINATCYSLTVGISNENGTSLIIANNNFLNIISNLDIYGNNDSAHPTLFSVGDGTLNVGGNLTFYASPGYANLELGNGTINVTGNLDFNASGQGNIKRRSVASSGTINLGGTVLGTGSIEGNTPNLNVPALPNDYYRSKSSGNWSALGSWESSRDGVSNWVNVTGPPSGSARRIEIRAAHKISLLESSTAANLFVYGTLECADDKSIKGPGPFTLADNATLITANSLGITSSGLTGAIQVDGVRSYSPNANYTYNGSVNQCTGSGLPATLNGILTIDKTDRTLTVSVCNPVLITKLVRVNQGELKSDNNLTLQSTQTNYAQIDKIDVNNAKISGPVNVQSFITGNLNIINRGTRMISVPVKDDFTKTIYQQLQEKIVITGPGGTANGFDAGGGNPNAETLTTYFEPAIPSLSNVAIPDINKTFPRTISGKAVHVYFRGNRDNALGNKVNGPNYAKPEDVVVNYKGTINQGLVPVTITYTNNLNDQNNGLNAVGNPYPAAIDWEKVYTTNQTLVSNEIRIIKPGGGIVTRKKNVDGSVAVVPVEYTTSSQFIQPGQGFYIKKSVAGEGTFSFLESHKAVDFPSARLLSNPFPNLLATHLDKGQHVSDVTQKFKSLRFNVQQGDLKDEALILFGKGLSPSFDKEDAIYFSGNTVMVGSLSDDNKNTCINAMPEAKDIKQLRLYVNANLSGTLKLNFIDLSAADGYQLYLKDALKPDYLIDVKKQPSYDVNIDKTIPSTYGNGRFTLIFQPEPPSLFTAERLKSTVGINWTSHISDAVDSFQVEVSLDNATFKKIGTVRNGGVVQTGAKYSYIDKRPATGINFYRLKQYNVNGTISYSDVRLVDLSNSLANDPSTISVYPNPSTEKITIRLGSKPQGEIEASIIDVQGRLLQTSTFTSGNNISFQVGHFPAGVYLIRIKDKLNNNILGDTKFVVGF